MPTAPLRLLVIILGGLLLRACLFPFDAPLRDMRDFVQWTLTIEQFGTHGFYAHATDGGGHFVDYPPGFPLVLTAFAYLDAHVLGASHAAIRWLVKGVATLGDVGMSLAVFALAQRTGGTRRALVAAAFVMFTPVTWLISAYWGQVDSLPACCLLFAVLAAVRGRFVAAWLLLACAVLIKPQPLVVAPILLVWQIRAQGWSVRLLVPAVAGAAVAYLGALPFAPSAAPGAALAWLAGRYAAGTQLYPYTSVSAFNVYTLHGDFFVSDTRAVAGLPIATWGILAFVAVLVAVVLMLRRRLATRASLAGGEPLLYTACFAVLCALFVLTTRMHERYLFSALAFAPLLVFAGPWQRGIAIATTITFTINCALVLEMQVMGSADRSVRVLMHALSLVNVGALVVALSCLAGGTPRMQRLPEPARTSPRPAAV